MKKPILFDQTFTAYKDAPDLKAAGFYQATLITAFGLYAKTPKGDYVPNEISPAVCQAVASDAKFWDGRGDTMIILDEEALDNHSPDLPKRDHIHDQLIEAVQIYRKHRPGQAIGYYAKIPRREYWAAVLGGPGERFEKQNQDWKDQNGQWLSNIDDNTLAQQKTGLADVIDRVFPSLYFWYELPQNWAAYRKYVDANLEQAARYRKPIFAYLTPHQISGNYPYWPRGIWAEMLRTVLRDDRVSGCVIFSHVAHGTPFESSMDWWQETIEVAEERLI